MEFSWDLDMALVIEVFGFMQKKGRYVTVCFVFGTRAVVLPQTLARGFGVDGWDIARFRVALKLNVVF